MKARYLLSLALVICLGFWGNIASAEEGKLSFGIEGGVVYADIGAEDTAQSLANLSGASVTLTADEYTWMARPFVDYQFSDNLSAEVGIFLTGSLDAKYTLSGASATEGYVAWGLDTALVLKSPEHPFYGKVGVHQSQIEGDATITIGGTTFSVSDSESGPGWLVGIGFMFKDKKAFIGLTHYGNVGGIESADFTFLSLGYNF